MSNMYNLIFGRNPYSALLLAVIRFKEVDVERFRDVHLTDDGKQIAVYARTGGNNRADYPQKSLYKSPLFDRTEDDDFDSTYATFYFNTPAEFVDDVNNLADILANGLRKEFGEHLLKTVNREPTEDDKYRAAYDAERAALRRTNHFMANGHTFVPKADDAMEAALKLAEENGGELRSCWGILPLVIDVETNIYKELKPKNAPAYILCTRIDTRVKFRWEIDLRYWEHCQDRFGEMYPISMKKIARRVDDRRAKAEGKSE